MGKKAYSEDIDGLCLLASSYGSTPEQLYESPHPSEARE